MVLWKSKFLNHSTLRPNSDFMVLDAWMSVLRNVKLILSFDYLLLFTMINQMLVKPNRKII